MTLTRSEWNVAVIGHWNRAILTPDGITARLFQLSDNANISVEIPADGLGPYRVLHDGLIVTATSSRLEITPNEPDLDKLDRAIEIARRAVETLPETPLRAAGINLRFKLEDAPPQFFDLLDTGFKDNLSDQNLIVKQSTFRYSVAKDAGLMNIEIIEDEQLNWLLNFNFHIDAENRDDLLEWLRQDAATLFSTVLNEVLTPSGLHEEQTDVVNSEQ